MRERRQRVPISGRDFSEMNTNLGKSRARLRNAGSTFVYRRNQLKVIPVACGARTRSVLSNATPRLIYILKNLTAELLKKSKDYLTAEED